MESRVREALQGVRPYLESHGGDVELLGIEGSAVRLRLRGSCSGCPSSAMTLKLAIEDAIHAAAPEIEEVIAAEEGAPPMGSPLLQIEDALPAALPLLAIEVTPAAAAPAQRNGSWSMAGTLAELSSAGSAVKTVGGQPILFLRLEGSFYGYRPFCPACQASLEQAVVRAAELTCPACGERFDVLRAGRGLDSPALHLQPVPLLVGDDGLVKVALPMGA
ncbi:MAG: NifU family protein [Solirubrobacterales bacterium]|nr:NifU family protein [Solirubrobacterales bacterium]